MRRIAVLFHKPSDSWQDRFIQIFIPEIFRRDFLHVSFAFDDDGYTFTSRGLEVLDIKSSVLDSVHYFYTDDPDYYSDEAFSRCIQKVTLWSLLLARLGFQTNTCASLVGEILWGEYLPYPCQSKKCILDSERWN